MSDAVSVQAALAEGYLRKGEFRPAEEAAARALESAPDDPQLRRFYVLALRGQERFSEATDEAVALAMARSEDTDAVVLLGECLLRSGRPAAARAVLRRAVRLDPSERRGRLLLNEADLAVSASPERQEEHDREESDIYLRLDWEPEEADPGPATMTLDVSDLDVEELGSVRSLEGCEIVDDLDVVEAVAAPPEPGAEEDVAADEVTRPAASMPAPPEEEEDEAPATDPDTAPAPPEEPEPTVPEPVSGPHLLEDEAAPSEDEPDEELLDDEIPEVEPDVAEPPDLLGDDEATREFDLALYAPRPVPEAEPVAPLHVTVLPPREPASDPGLPTPPPPAPEPSTAPTTPSMPVADRGPTVPARAEVTPIVRTEGTLPWLLRSPLRWVVPVLVLVALGATLVALHVRGRRQVADRVDRARRTLLTGRDADYAAAAALLAENLADAPDHAPSLALAALVHAARAFELSAPAAEAQRLLEQAARATPTAAETCAARAYLALRSLRTEAARVTVAPCLQTHGEDPFLRYLHGRALSHTSDTQGAAAALDIALAGHPGMVVALVARAELLAHVGDYSAAVASLTRVEQAAPGLPHALVARARVGLQALRDLEGVDAALRSLAEQSEDLTAGRKAWLHLLQARLLRVRGRQSEAAARLQEALALKADAPAFLLEAGQEALAVWRAGVGEELLTTAAAAGAPRTALAVPSARLALALGRPDEALESLQAAPADLPDTHLLRARAHLLLGRMPAARRSHLAAADRPGAAVLEAQISYREGRTEEALGRLRSLAAGRRDAAAVEALGRILLERGEVEECRGLLSEALTVASDHPAIRTLLGELHLRAGRSQLAQEQYRRALDVFPKSTHARLGLVRALLGRGVVSEAEAALAPLLKTEGAPAAARLTLAEVRLAQGRTEEAREALGRATAGGAAGVRASRVAGLLALAERRPARAVALLASAVEEAPGDGDLRLALARALLADNRAREARGVLRPVLKGDPDHPEGRLLLGRVYTDLEEDSQAIAELSRSVRSAEVRDLAPDRRAEALAALAVAHYYYEEYGQALVTLDDAEGLQAGRADVYLYRGMTFDKLERPTRARQQYEKALELDAGLAEAHYRYGASLMARGESKEEAAAHLRRYLALAPSGRYRSRANRLLGER